MTIEFHCPHCDKLLKTPDDKAGVRANCPGCGEQVTVPATVDSPADFDDSFGTKADSPAQSNIASTATDRQQEPEIGVATARTNCPMCGEEIAAAARRCRFCGEEIGAARSSRGNLAAHRGVLILIFGILGWVICFPFGIAAWIMASHDLREMDEGRMDNEGRGLTYAGKILGIVQCCLFAVSIVFVAGMALLGLMSQ